MNRWPIEKHFTSWLTLAPQNKVSGGRFLSSRTQPSANRTAAILRMAAMSLGRTQTALGAYFRRLADRVGKAKAVTATARKLAILVYRTFKHGLVYKDPGAAAYNSQDRERLVLSSHSTRYRPRLRSLGHAVRRGDLRRQFLRRRFPSTPLKDPVAIGQRILRLYVRQEIQPKRCDPRLVLTVSLEIFDEVHVLEKPQVVRHLCRM